MRNAWVAGMLLLGLATSCAKTEGPEQKGPDPAVVAANAAAEAAAKQAAEERMKAEEEAARKAAEEQKKADEEALKRAAEEKRRTEEEAARKAAEEKQKAEEAAAVRKAAEEAKKTLPVQEIRKRQARFAPVKITWDRTLLTEQELAALKPIIGAARVMDRLFWKQASADGLALREEYAQRTDPDSRAVFHYVLTNYGRFARLDNDEPFIGVKPKPLGANYYPEDMTKEEFERHLADNPKDADAFKSNFTVIRRVDGKLVAVPYSREYKSELEAASQLLLNAAGQTENPSLKRYLETRARGFLTDDYFESDVAWMDLDSKLEVVVGPYEVYEDKLFGYKAAFEAFVTVRDPAATAKLKKFESWIDRMEANLPIPDELKNMKRGKESPMLVVDVIYTSGDTRAGPQTIAFNLPNDERVREQKGSKKVMLRNVMAAKFRMILRPIADLVLSGELMSSLHEEAYFAHTLLHEISHGLGPGNITVQGEKTTVSLALKEISPHLEEAKAEALGVYNALFLVDKGVLKLQALEDGAPKGKGLLKKEEAQAAVVTTFVAGIFRSTRFGVEEAHGKASLVIFNYLKEKGAVWFTPEGKVAYDFTKAAAAFGDCAHEILMIQAAGDYAAGKAFLEKYGVLSDEMKAALGRLEQVPVDIEPQYEMPE